MFNIIFWNVRGACVRCMFRNIKLLRSKYNPAMILLAETKCESDGRLQCLRKLGFNELVSIPSVGQFGGIAAAWKSNFLNVSVLYSHRQYLHLNYIGGGISPFVLTGVYALPEANHKLMLWEDMRGLTSSIVEPWVVMGDFNDISATSERTGR